MPGKQICNAIFEELCILANGEVVCSCGDPAGLKVYGNIREQTLGEIFNSRAYRAMRRYQLNTRPSCYCPTLGENCGGRVYKATRLHTERGLAIRKLQLEPISYCNLDCPECPVHNFSDDPHYRDNRRDKLSVSEMLDLVRQLPSLDELLYYNFGEPFLHSGTIEFLRGAKQIRPGLKIDTSTNGIPLNGKISEIIAKERLLNSILFSIDGAHQNSYGVYRRNGDFQKAFENMVYMRNAINRHGAEKDIQLDWQYILFEWNDSDEEIARAQSLSEAHDIPIKWVLTHTPGKSKRFTYGSDIYRALVSDAGCYQNLTCELQCHDMTANGLKGAIYSQEIKYLNPQYDGGVLSMDVEVRNCSGADWVKSDEHPFCIGLQILDEAANVLGEYSIGILERTIRSGEKAVMHAKVRIPNLTSEKYLLLDMIHGWICWFRKRGAQATVFPASEITGLRKVDASCLERKFSCEQEKP